MARGRDKKQLQILIDTSQGVDELGYLQEQYKLLAQQIKASNDEINKSALENSLAVTKERMEDLREELGLEGMTVNQLRNYYRQLETEKKNALGTRQKEIVADQERILNQLDAVNTGLDRRSRKEKALNAELQKSIKVNGLTGLSLDQLKLHHKNLTAQIAESAKFESATNQKRIAEARKVESMISARKQKISGAGGIIGSIKANLGPAMAGGIAGGIVGLVGTGLTEMMSRLTDSMRKSAEFLGKNSRYVSEIQNILMVSREEAKEILKDLSDINTATSRENLKELVLVAGDLNVAKEDVEGFVIAADKLETVLSRDFGGVGNASTEVFKLAKNFKETKDLAPDEMYAKIGSSIKTLNDEGPATTKGMVEFINRIGQLPEAFKPAITEAAAFAAVFEEANLTAQISSGGISNVLLVASRHAEDFSKMFGMSADEFQKFVSQDPTKFLLQFASAIQEMDESKVGELFKKLHIESQESIKTMGVLSTNINKFYEKWRTAHESFESGTRLDEVHANLNEDLQSELTKAEKKITAWQNRIASGFGAMYAQAKIYFSKMVAIPSEESSYVGGFGVYAGSKDLENRLNAAAATKAVDTANTIVKSDQTIQESLAITKAAMNSLNRTIIDMKALPNPDVNAVLNSSSDNKSTTNTTSKLDKERQARIDNEAKTLQEIYRMNVEAIENQLQREEVMLKLQFENVAAQKRKEVDEKKLSVETFNAWYFATEKNIERKISEAKLNQEKKENEQRQKLAEDTQKMILRNAMTSAELHGDEEAVLFAEMALRRHQFEIDIEKATAEQKNAIYQAYLLDIEKLEKDFNDKKAEERLRAEEKIAKTEADRQEKINEKNKSDAKIISDLKLELVRDIEKATFSIIQSNLQRQLQEKEASFEKENKALKAQFEQGILDEKEYKAAQLAMEKKQEAELAKIKRKQAIAEKAAALFNIAINTAVAAVKAAASVGPVGMALAIASGAVQAAAVAARPIPSFYAGGKTGSFDDFGGFPAILHPNEYVVPNIVTQSPEFAAFAPMLESARLKGSNSFKTSNEPNPTIPTRSSTAPGSSQQGSDLSKTLEKNTEVNEKLLEKLDHLTVRFGGSDIDRLVEMIDEFNEQNEKSLI